MFESARTSTFMDVDPVAVAIYPVYVEMLPYQSYYCLRSRPGADPTFRKQAHRSPSKDQRSRGYLEFSSGVPHQNFGVLHLADAADTSSYLSSTHSTLTTRDTYIFLSTSTSSIHLVRFPYIRVPFDSSPLHTSPSFVYIYHSHPHRHGDQSRALRWICIIIQHMSNAKRRLLEVSSG